MMSRPGHLRYAVDQTPQTCLHGVGSSVAWNRPGDVHRVLQRLSDTEGAVQRDEDTDDHGGSDALEALRVVQLVADDRELAQRRVEDPLLQVAVALKRKPSSDVSRSSSGNRDRKP